MSKIQCCPCIKWGHELLHKVTCITCKCALPAANIHMPHQAMPAQEAMLSIQAESTAANAASVRNPRSYHNVLIGQKFQGRRAMKSQILKTWLNRKQHIQPTICPFTLPTHGSGPKMKKCTDSLRVAIARLRSKLPVGGLGTAFRIMAMLRLEIYVVRSSMSSTKQSCACANKSIRWPRFAALMAAHLCPGAHGSRALLLVLPTQSPALANRTNANVGRPFGTAIAGAAALPILSGCASTACPPATSNFNLNPFSPAALPLVVWPCGTSVPHGRASTRRPPDEVKDLCATAVLIHASGPAIAFLQFEAHRPLLGS